MKNLKSGFTLAEVLITLSIIGIIAAIVMPAVISSYQYKTVGVKLGKFATTTEDASRAFVVQNNTFKTNTDAMNFINEAYLFKSLTGTQNGQLAKTTLGVSDLTDYPTYYTVETAEMEPSKTPDKYTQSGLIGVLKDNTTVVINMVKDSEYTTHKGVVNIDKVGLPVFNINIDPKANGLPKSVQKNFNFTVTELGYVFPRDNDACLWKIYNDDWATNAKTFTSGSVCNPKTTTGK